MSEVKVKANPKGFRRDISSPRRPVPDGACDCHMHIVGPFARYPKRELASLDPPESLLEDYLKVSAKLGLSRTVVVQPSFYARDKPARSIRSTAWANGRARWSWSIRT